MVLTRRHEHVMNRLLVQRYLHSVYFGFSTEQITVGSSQLGRKVCAEIIFKIHVFSVQNNIVFLYAEDVLRCITK